MSSAESFFAARAKPDCGQSNMLPTLLWNSAWMAVSRLLVVVTQLLCVPAILDGMGTNGLGIWECLAAISGFVISLQLVIGSTLIWRMSYWVGRNDPQKICRLVQTGIFLSIVVAGFAWGGMKILAPWIVAAIRVPETLVVECGFLIPRIAALTALMGVSETLLAVCISHHRAAYATAVQSLTLIVTNSVTIALLFSDFGLSSLVLGQAAGLLFSLLTSYLAATKCMEQRLPLIPVSMEWSELKCMSGFASLIAISQIAMLFRDHLDRFLVAYLSTPEVTGAFGIARTLALSIGQVSGFIAMPLIAALGYMNGKEDREGVGRLFSFSNRAIEVLTGSLTFWVCAMHLEIFTVWLGNDQPLSKEFLAIQLLGWGTI